MFSVVFIHIPLTFPESLRDKVYHGYLWQTAMCESRVGKKVRSELRSSQVPPFPLAKFMVLSLDNR